MEPGYDLRMVRKVILLIALLVAGWLVVSEIRAGNSPLGQDGNRLTAIQREIELQRRRLSSSEVEERRDALTRLGNLHRPDASRAATAGLTDPIPIVRVAAAHAVLFLPPAEAVTLLIPLLQDKSEFVRREAAYALGETHNRAAVEPLANLLLVDKEAGVRGAAAVALGEIREESAVPALSQVFGPASIQKKKKSKGEENEFVLRAAARSLGQIRSRAAVDVLIGALQNTTYAGDVRREAAIALGLIGDSAAVPALRAAFSSEDPYLSEAARAALRRLRAPVN